MKPKQLYHSRFVGDIRYFCEERFAFDRIAESFFGFVPQSGLLVRLIGADERSEISLGTLRGRLYAEHIEVKYLGLFGNCRISRSRMGCLRIFQESNMFHKGVPREKLETIFQRQIEACREMSIDQIIMFGRKSQLQQSFYLLPLFGFDGPLPNAIYPILPDQFHSLRTFGELFRTKNGQKWWENYGSSIPMPLRFTVNKDPYENN